MSKVREERPTYADRLLWLRRCADVSQREVARLSGLSASNVGQLEVLKPNHVAYRTLWEIARVFGVSIVWLAEGKGKAPKESAIGRAVARARRGFDAGSRLQWV